MFPYKKILVVSCLFSFAVIGIVSMRPPGEDEHYKNLKVLSKDISEDQLEHIMYRFGKDLGVNCRYCHVPTKDTVNLRMDFASDAKKEKLIAREMLKMTFSLNKKYFNTKIDKKITVQPMIWCRTCHRGYAIPHYP